MEIKKNYDIGAIANEIKNRITISSNREVYIDVLLAQNIVDVLEEVSRRETIERIETEKPMIHVPEKLQPASPAKDGNEILPENMKAGCDDKPMLRQCTNCLMKDKGCNRDCKNNRITAKMLRDRTGCFGDYDSTDGTCGKCKYLELCREWRAKKEPCFGCYDDENFDSDCSECEYSIVCRRATNNA